MSKEKQVGEMVELFLRNTPLSTISCEDLAELMYDSGYRKASKVAREIFEEIEKIIDKRYNQHIFGCNDLDDEEHEAIINFSDDISGDIDKLKEKYT